MTTPTDSARVSAVPSARKARKRRLAARGWVPDQHGAWAMAILPPILGIVEGGALPRHALMFGAWFAAFGAFCAFETYCKTPVRRKARVRPALLAWSGLAALFGVPLLIARPSLFAWAPYFAPLALIALVEVLRGRERAIATRIASLLAAALMTPVAASIGLDTTDPLSPALARAWILGALIGAYFLGTVPLVRSLVRGRGEDRWIVASGVWHLVSLAGTLLAVRAGFVVPALVPLWIALAVRAVAMPLAQRRGVRFTPKTIGRGEMAWSALVVICLLWAV